MIRKKKPKMIRKILKIRKPKSTIILSNPILRNWGGCIPHVGNDCLKEHLRFKDNGVLWLDSGICHTCANKPCEYYKQWKLNRGIKIDKNTDTITKIVMINEPIECEL